MGAIALKQGPCYFLRIFHASSPGYSFVTASVASV